VGRDRGAVMAMWHDGTSRRRIASRAGSAHRFRARIAMIVACIASWAACSETTGPNEPFSLEFAPLPAPSIVSGDTLRDIDGNAIPLEATAFNLKGRALDDAGISFVAIDTSGAISIDQTTGYVIATGTRRGTVRLIAAVGSLQSAPTTLEIVPAPSSAAQSGAIDTLRYSFSNPSFNTSGPLRVIVRRDSANAPVPRYLVRFRLADLADTVVARLVDDAARRSPLDPTGATAVDTTGADGIASRQIRLTPGGSLATPVDSIVVFADVRLRGADVSGSPVRLVLPVKQRTTP
jgi:hypothetical protein